MQIKFYSLNVLNIDVIGYKLLITILKIDDVIIFDMSNSENLIVYYSCFNLISEVTDHDLQHLIPYKNAILQTLGLAWYTSLKREFELLNIRPSKWCIELCCEVWFKSAVPSQDYNTFKTEFIKELDLDKIWTAKNPDCISLEKLLSRFVEAVSSLPVIQKHEFHLLPSLRTLPELEPLMVASESEMTLSQRVYRVLQRVSTPFESLIGQDLTDSLKRYLLKISDKLNTTYQVTSEFVTNTIEIRPLRNNLQVRVIQPAKDFYEKATETFISLNSTLDPQQFLLQVQYRLDTLWNDRLIIPTLQFFRIAEEEWMHSLNPDHFLELLKSQLYNKWMSSVVHNSQNFEQHMMPKTML